MVFSVYPAKKPWRIPPRKQIELHQSQNLQHRMPQAASEFEKHRQKIRTKAIHSCVRTALTLVHTKLFTSGAAWSTWRTTRSATAVCTAPHRRSGNLQRVAQKLAPFTAAFVRKAHPAVRTCHPIEPDLPVLRHPRAFAATAFRPSLNRSSRAWSHKHSRLSCSRSWANSRLLRAPHAASSLLCRFGN